MCPTPLIFSRIITLHSANNSAHYLKVEIGSSRPKLWCFADLLFPRSPLEKVQTHPPEDDANDDEEMQGMFNFIISMLEGGESDAQYSITDEKDSDQDESDAECCRTDAENVDTTGSDMELLSIVEECSDESGPDKIKI